MYTLIQANLNHLDDLAVLFDAYRVFYKKETDLDAAKKFLRERLANDQSVIFMVYNDSRAVGFTQLYPVFSSVNMAAVWLLNDLFVDPVYRGKKIGKQLLEAAQNHCTASGAKGVSLETEQTNVVGNKLYPIMGFEKDTEHNFYYWENPTFSTE
ncbi:MAG: GNAT family N-acetyltransferase [Flavobacteriales bacterium]|jgi:GNAT superfamily N-acetyltransferase|uniref:Gcn5-related N-acetyltransferase n=1 Tax=uncultured Flavobacteriia bacterium TaxID=212695 RepID=H6RDW6_9BACT|nr:acetyltransferase, GNAT family [uncultured bacterium]CCF99227.1 gcn5-related N-acetyltransferase [uncultured Flavobacteriia bacterium]|tara:strand:+ start:126 stop:587 length:462 start_codon:yes stop_codon:yes gene_type:complete